jgi:hypothetical protein
VGTVVLSGDGGVCAERSGAQWAQWCSVVMGTAVLSGDGGVCAERSGAPGVLRGHSGDGGVCAERSGAQPAGAGWCGDVRCLERWFRFEPFCCLVTMF